MSLGSITHAKHWHLVWQDTCTANTLHIFRQEKIRQGYACDIHQTEKKCRRYNLNTSILNKVASFPQNYTRNNSDILLVIGKYKLPFMKTSNEVLRDIKSFITME